MNATERSRNARKRARIAQGRPGGGRFAPQESSESALPQLVDPADDVATETEHELAHLGISTVTRTDGVVVARNSRGPGIICPICRGERTRQAICSSCFGRGHVSDVPFCDRPWDQVVQLPSGGTIHLGGHDCQPSGGSAVVTDQFDVVISLYSREGWGPNDDVEHHRHTMVDGALDPEDHARLHELADVAVSAVTSGRSVLIRCQAGMNRSGLVTGLAMVKLGWHAQDAIEHMRAQRGPYVLFNDDFVEFIHAAQKRPPAPPLTA